EDIGEPADPAAFATAIPHLARRRHVPRRRRAAAIPHPRDRSGNRPGRGEGDVQSGLGRRAGRRMIETHEFTGVWWLPSDDSRKLSGTLTIERGHAALDVVGSFSSDPNPFTPGPDLARIVGMSTTGRR